MDSSNHSCERNDGKDVVQIEYYKLNEVEKDQIVSYLDKAAAALNALSLKDSKNPNEFVQKMFENDDVCSMLISLSRLPVFSKEFAEALKHNLDLLATAKKLKYFTNLSLGQNAILLKNLAAELSSPVDGMQTQVDRLFAE